MKILFIAPKHSGIDVYVKRLSGELKKKGHAVTWIGSIKRNYPFDVRVSTWRSADCVERQLKHLIARINFDAYDIVTFHYGKNDIEQYLPVIIGKITPVKVYFTHYLSWLLFKKYIPDEKRFKDVKSSVFNYYDAYVFYCDFAKRFMEKRAGRDLKNIVSFYPETHSRCKIRKERADNLLKEFNVNPLEKNIFLPGYASAYKDSKTLLKVFSLVTSKLNFYFIGRGWLKKIGWRRKRIGQIRVFVFDRELKSNEFKCIIQQSLFGIFPYAQPEGPYEETFQGSGVVPNFIYQGKACLAFDEGGITQMIGAAGIVFKKQRVAELARAIDEMVDRNKRRKYELEALKRKHLFSIESHAQDCIELFRKII